jgi:hypothetical protein
MTARLITVVECSTGHLTRDEDTLVRGGEVVLCAPYEFGQFVWIDDGLVDGTHPDAELVPNLVAVCAYVRAHHPSVEWIRFDGDAEAIEELPVYDW